MVRLYVRESYVYISKPYTVISTIVPNILIAIKKSVLRFHCFLVFVFLFITFQGSCQTSTIDSLKGLLNHVEEPEEKFKLVSQLSKLTVKTDPIEGFKYVEEAVRLASILKSDSAINSANADLATAYLRLENYPKAMQLSFKLIQSQKNNPDPNLLFAAYNNLGNIYIFQSDFKNSIKAFKKALEYVDAIKVNQLERKSGILNNIGTCYREMKDYDNATAYFNQSLQLSKKINYQENIANVLNNQGLIYQFSGKKDLALKNFSEALSIREKTNNKSGIASSNYRIGELFFKFKDYRQAEFHLKKAISIGDSVGSIQLVSYASSYLYQLYKQEKRFKEAFEALELSNKTNDSIFNESRTRQIAQLEMQFEFDHKQNELRAKQREKDLYYLLGAITLGFSLVIITLLFFLQRNRTRRSQLEQEHLLLEKKNLERDIELKDKELTTNILHLIQKNELIDTISDKLHEIKLKTKDESQPAVQKVINDLQSNIQPDLLQEFEYRFQQVHEEFYTILNERFPNLSPSERRLCAFLKLNMTTKEISAITHQNIKSIEIARTRLRKKLNLTGTDQNLVTFLAQLH